MRVYSLSDMNKDYLGCEMDGRMIDLTRAISLYETIHGHILEIPPIDIVELIWDGVFTGEYLGSVLETMDKYGLVNDLIVDNEYSVEAPIYPGKIIALGNNYRAHVEEMGQNLPEEPVLFGKWASTIIGHGEDIVIPEGIGRVDFEAELAFIIGKSAKGVPRAEAMDYVAGYTCLNDVSAREMQGRDIARSLPWMQSKNFDTFAPIGPCVLIADAIEPPVEIDIQCRVNGEVRQDSNTRDFIFDIPAMIAYITKIMTLELGDVVTTGTPSGVGPIKPGDVVNVTCSGIGTLSNPVAVSHSD